MEALNPQLKQQLKEQLNKLWEVSAMDEGNAKEAKRKEVLEDVANVVSNSDAPEAVKKEASDIASKGEFTKGEFTKLLGLLKDTLNPPEGGRRRRRGKKTRGRRRSKKSRHTRRR